MPDGSWSKCSQLNELGQQFVLNDAIDNPDCNFDLKVSALCCAHRVLSTVTRLNLLTLTCFSQGLAPSSMWLVLSKASRFVNSGGMLHLDMFRIQSSLLMSAPRRQLQSTGVKLDATAR